MTTLKNTLHDSNNGLNYTLVNDHYLPNLTVAAPAEHPTGRWGRLHRRRRYLRGFLPPQRGLCGAGCRRASPLRKQPWDQ